MLTLWSIRGEKIEFFKKGVNFLAKRRTLHGGISRKNLPYYF